MNIRTRLAVQFSLLASFILGAAFLVVYLRAAEFRQEQFRDRLYERGKNVANLLLQVDEVDERLLRKIELNSTVRLPEEVIALFDDHDEQVLRLGVDKDLPFGEMIAIAKKQGTMFRVDDGRESIGFVFQNGTLSNTVIASGFDRFGRGKLNDQAKVMLATFLIGLVTIFLIGRVFAKRALSPFQRLVQELHSIGASDLSKRVDPGMAQMKRRNWLRPSTHCWNACKGPLPRRRTLFPTLHTKCGIRLPQFQARSMCSY